MVLAWYRLDFFRLFLQPYQAQAKLQIEREERNELSERFLKLQEKERLYYSTVKAFQDVGLMLEYWGLDSYRYNIIFYFSLL